MAKFTIRVELHDAREEDYENLHAAMEKQGFSRTITDDDGVSYHLPPAEYNRLGQLTRDQVLESAKNAATATRLSFSILVSESEARMWWNLDKVKP
jgi:hypothetical protein